MKNIHIISTNKPSRLHYSKVKSSEGICYKLNFIQEESKCNDGFLSGQRHIYITNDEEIKEGYVLNTFNNTVYKIVPDNSSREILANSTTLPLCAINREHYFKIILTTDPELIKDGVQAIDDEFLEWFIKNPSCEFVKVEGHIYKGQDETEYKIIIPKEEPKQELSIKELNRLDDIEIEEMSNDWETMKNQVESKRELNLSESFNGSEQIMEFKQETLEEAGLKHCDILDKFPALINPLFSFKAGAKWQQEKSYSEEEMINFAFDTYNYISKLMKVPFNLISENRLHFTYNFKQFKKK
jgi:hypothetical protein